MTVVCVTWMSSEIKICSSSECRSENNIVYISDCVIKCQTFTCLLLCLQFLSTVLCKCLMLLGMPGCNRLWWEWVSSTSGNGRQRLELFLRCRPCRSQIDLVWLYINCMWTKCLASCFDPEHPFFYLAPETSSLLIDRHTWSQ